MFRSKILKNSCPYLLSALSGVLMALAYPPFDVPGIIWVGLVPLFFTIFGLRGRALRPIQAFFVGLIAGIFYFGIVFSWLFDTYPVDWAGIQNPFIGKSMVLGVWLFNIIVANALIYGLMSAFFVYYWARSKKAGDIKIKSVFLLSLWWILFEYIRSVWFSIIFSGSESLIGPHWTTGHIGYGLHDNYLLAQTADLWGIYGLGFIVVFINISIFYIIRLLLREKYEFVYTWKLLHVLKAILAVLILIIFALSYGYFSENKINSLIKNAPRIKVALMQTDFYSKSLITTDFLDQMQKKQSEMLREATDNNADIILFPEDSRFITKSKEDLPQRTDKQPYLLIQSSRTNSFSETKSKLYYFDSENGSKASREKQLLVPFGEYMPYILKIPARLLGFDYFVDFFEFSRGYSFGHNTEPAETRFGNINAIICSEPLSPALTRRLSKNAELLFNPSSEAVFHGSKSYMEQNKAVITIRAIESRRFIAQATNVGHSFALDASGRIISDSNSLGDKIIYTYAAPIKYSSFYSMLGEWLILCAALSALFIINKYHLNTQRKSDCLSSIN